ncbi:HlyD family type I secretion periplasmic adaptor subunit [Paracoccus beibuensis]|uniref:HlyD family type I secretion periplasmic adaptor subunit n=1 Tax=Paracoccus beibuensis TaxID=547602 RepID=UPI0022402CC2|nr:HlyD family type I secretion periplasmic adaptor subunit [Paracoccus beibuensis]
MRYEQIDRSITRSLRRQILGAFAISIILVGGTGSVAAVTEINGAVVGHGKLIVEGRPKNVQHLDGGTIREILVEEGQTVEAGQILFRLDPTVVEANLEIVNDQISTLEAERLRLEAELLEETEIDFPEALLAAESPRLRALVKGQRDLMAARLAARAGQRAQLTAQIAQLRSKIGALEAQRDATTQAVVLADEDLADKQYLSDRGLVSDGDLRAAKRERADLDAQIASLDAQLAETGDEILTRELQHAQIDEVFREEVLTRLDEVRAELARLQQERIAALDRQDRLAVRAPIAGGLHELAVHTRGQVVSPGERLVTLIAQGDRLVVETRLPPQDVDQVHRGQVARLRFSGLDQRVTPQVNASVIDVSPDASTDEATGATYFLARLAVDADQMARIEGSVLRPGMPVEVFIQTQSRTIMSYLVKPIVDQVQHAFREG